MSVPAGGTAAPGDERPPVGGSWRLLYALVIAALAAEVLLLAWLTEAFR